MKRPVSQTGESVDNLTKRPDQVEDRITGLEDKADE
jgi:hypothetical protein